MVGLENAFEGKKTIFVLYHGLERQVSVYN